MRIDGVWIKDDEGRNLLLRGINLGGSSKVPKIPDGATHLLENFFNHQDVSFKGRPFPLKEADEHFGRLREWGLKLIRFLVTWEAIEHKGPGIYDEEYLDYISAVIEKAGKYDLQVFIDPHQDAWSRFTGGDGAPGWTLEAVGFDIRRFKETGAAVTHQEYGDPFPWLIWPSNNDKLAAATMLTLFFGGNDFAPQTKIDGEAVQEYLQRRYIKAIKQVAYRLKDMPHVIGYETMNEPFPGWIGLNDLRKGNSIIRQEYFPTPWQSILLGSGYPQKVEYWHKYPKFGRIGRRWLNLQRVSVWRDGFSCVWKNNGVWDIDKKGNPVLLRPDHFRYVNTQQVNFTYDYYRTFANRFAAEIRKVHPQAIIFIESAPGETNYLWGKDDVKNIIYAPHWYDILLLATKKYRPLMAMDYWKRMLVLFRPFIRRSFASQLRFYHKQAEKQFGRVPVLIGEMGIPFNLDDSRAFETGDFSSQVRALNRCMRAVEDTLSHVTIWNYTADNSNPRGDQWNVEDFSVFSRDQQVDPSDINSGGRALKALIRPYPMAIAGEPVHLSFDIKKRIFKFRFNHASAICKPTEIFVPRYQYPEGYKVIVSDGRCQDDTTNQKLLYWHTEDRYIHEITLLPF